MTPTCRPRARWAATRAEVVVDFPTPGDPVNPMTWAVPEVGASSAITSGTWTEPSSTHEMSRATARGSPVRVRSTRSEASLKSGLGHSDDQRISLTAATAQRGRADTPTTALEFQRQMQGDASA